MRTLLLLVLVACGSKRHGTPCDQPGGKVCVGEDVVECTADRETGATLQTCPGLCSRGACPDSCGLKDVELIYTVDRDNYLSSFDPSKPVDQAFHKIGKLTCDPDDHPFSMAIDRNGIAWVLYSKGDLYKVSIVDAHCSSKPVLEIGGTFGMGFVSDGPKSTTEKLYMIDSNAGHPLNLIDTTGPLKLQAVAPKLEIPVMQNPELTGTGDGKLYGYFPQHGRGFVQELDRKTERMVGNPLLVATPQGNISAWAFAFWGGTFYLFATIDGHSNLYAKPRDNDGPTRLIRADLPAAVTGAGVSTCAPLLEKSS